jgi:hypothetical protein
VRARTYCVGGCASHHPDHRRFLIVDHAIGSTIFNLLLNALIAWLMVRTLASVTLWGQPGIAPDTIATAFFLPFLTCLIVGKIIDHQIASGRVRPVDSRALPSVSFAFRPRYQKGLVLGLASVVLAALRSFGRCLRRGRKPREESFIGFKASFAALLGALVTPLAWWALAVVETARDATVTWPE